MNIYLISQDEVIAYDTFDSAVVYAKDAKAARDTHPNGDFVSTWDGSLSTWDGSWCEKQFVKVKLIGSNPKRKKPGVICASFNAG